METKVIVGFTANAVCYWNDDAMANQVEYINIASDESAKPVVDAFNVYIARMIEIGWIKDCFDDSGDLRLIHPNGYVMNLSMDYVYE